MCLNFILSSILSVVITNFISYFCLNSILQSCGSAPYTSFLKICTRSFTPIFEIASKISWHVLERASKITWMIERAARTSALLCRADGFWMKGISLVNLARTYGIRLSELYPVLCRMLAVHFQLLLCLFSGGTNWNNSVSY